MVNRGRVRGLLGKLRGRVLHLQAERGALQEQLARLPEFGEGDGLLAAQVCCDGLQIPSSILYYLGA